MSETFSCRICELADKMFLSPVFDVVWLALAGIGLLGLLVYPLMLVWPVLFVMIVLRVMAHSLCESCPLPHGSGG